MHDIDAYLQTLTSSLGMPWEGLIKIFLAAVAGGSVGLERELRGRTAGLRTNILVCVGAALAMIVSISMASHPWKHSADFGINVDPARIAYGVMTGIGFLGAGTIIQSKGRISGLTSAAALWCMTAIGLAAGLGLYSLTILTTLLLLVVLLLLQKFEERLPRIKYATITIRRKWEDGCIHRTVEGLKKIGFRVADLHFERGNGTLENVEIELIIGFPSRSQFYDLAQAIEKEAGIELIKGRNL